MPAATILRRRLAYNLFWSDEDRRAWFEETLLRPGQVAALFQVSRRAVSLWAASGRLPFIETPGGHRRYRASDVHALIARLRVGGDV